MAKQIKLSKKRLEESKREKEKKKYKKDMENWQKFLQYSFSARWWVPFTQKCNRKRWKGVF